MGYGKDGKEWPFRFYNEPGLFAFCDLIKRDLISCSPGGNGRVKKGLDFGYAMVKENFVLI